MKNLIKKYFTDEELKKMFNLTLDENKRLIRKFKEEIKYAKKTNQRKLCLGEYIHKDYIYNFLHNQNIFFYDKYQKEKERAWKYLNDDENAEKYGYIDIYKYQKMVNEGTIKRFPKPKPDEIMLQWAEQAYPNVNTNLWEAEFEKGILERLIKLY